MVMKQEITMTMTSLKKYIYFSTALNTDPTNVAEYYYQT